MLFLHTLRIQVRNDRFHDLAIVPTVSCVIISKPESERIPRSESLILHSISASQDEHYDSRKRSYTTSYTIVYSRIRRILRPYTIVFMVVYLPPDLRPQNRRVVYDEIRRIYDHRKRSYTIVYNVVCQRIPISFSYVPLSTLQIIQN